MHAVIVGVIPDQPARVLKEAARYAKLFAAPLIVAHVDITRFVTYEDPDGYVHSAPIDLDAATGQSQLAAVTDAATAALGAAGTGGVDWSVHQLVGDPALAIKHLAEQYRGRDAAALTPMREAVSELGLPGLSRGRPAMAQQVLRTQEAVLQKETERIAHETAQREAQLRSAVASADARVRSLHTTIAQLNANAAALADVPGTSAGACAAPGSDAAATARELLGESSGAYQELAAEADQLRDQVIGLQQFARDVCRAGTSGGAIDR